MPKTRHGRGRSLHRSKFYAGEPHAAFVGKGEARGITGAQLVEFPITDFWVVLASHESKAKEHERRPRRNGAAVAVRLRRVPGGSEARTESTRERVSGAALARR